MRSQPALLKACVDARPQFFDVDPMNVVWHGNYPKFLELARVALLNEIDYGYAKMVASGYSWPVVDMGIKFISPIFLHQSIEIEAALVEWENRLKLGFEIRDKLTRKRLTRAHAVQVAVEASTGEMQWETPPIFREKLKAWLV